MQKAIHLTVKTNLVLIRQQYLLEFICWRQVTSVLLTYSVSYLPSANSIFIRVCALGFVFPHSIPPSSLHHWTLTRSLHSTVFFASVILVSFFLLGCFDSLFSIFAWFTPPLFRDSFSIIPYRKSLKTK